jgi:hypothetical protein
MHDLTVLQSAYSYSYLTAVSSIHPDDAEVGILFHSGSYPDCLDDVLFEGCSTAICSKSPPRRACL